MNVNPGELNKKINIILPSAAEDADGYSTGSPTTVLSNRAAKFSRTSGTELTKANADFSDVKVRFLIRYTSTAITRKMLVVYRGAEYEIDYVNDYEDKHEYIEIFASRKTVKAK